MVCWITKTAKDEKEECNRCYCYFYLNSYIIIEIFGSNMKSKKAFTNMIGWVAFVIALILLILLFTNDMSIKAVVDEILVWFS